MVKLLKSKKDINFYLDDFMEYCTLKDLSKKTLNSYESTLMLFIKYLEEEYQIVDIQKVKKDHIEDYIDFTKNRGKYSFVSDEKTIKINHPEYRKDFGKEISTSTINNHLRNIKVFFNYCYEKKYIKSNLVDKLKFVKTKRKMKDEITDSEFKALIKAINVTIYSEYRDYTIIQLIFDTGMRLSETFFSNTMANILRKWLQYKDRYCNSDYLFPKNGKIITASNFGRNFRMYVNKPITAHCLRNNFAKRFLLSGGDIFMLSKILGHSSVTVTEQAYLDVTMSDIRKSYQRYSPLESMK
ncbi:MAG: tyrosine-type recombinase/integrase [Clostridium sp.]|nr:tyrosine-type recombinase/integrase [Clostridium sp.]MBS5948779.1 tyrosine-type recombinase/integrase [Clostridium sp.]